ncbi:aldo/keto reductase [Kordiimonas sediminis]|uniref:Aldo/keto reductase n=1 Tax=Kordiimonas sediminis TaxID=1735581 RepID=A0A919E4V7_9PROT|nr:aldo/keto reductase [Kordiimonas sediminis]GHF14096.1 aldo/keto reductase [Kordiimonas sediminis]
MQAERRLGNQLVPPVGLGCMCLSHGYFPVPDPAEGLKLLHAALDMGYRHFDTARLYGMGKNEELVANVLRDRRDDVFLASKCGFNMEGGPRRIDCRPDTIKRAVDTSLRTLGVDHIDLYYLHRRDFDVPIEESVGTLGDLIAAGKIGGIGLSEMSAETLRKAAKEHPIAAMQSEYSLWTRNPEIAVLDACKELGTAFVAFSPLGRGALAGAVSNPAALPDPDMRKTQPRFSEDHWPANKKLLAEFAALAKDHDMTPAQLALAWLLAADDTLHVIPGTGSIAHLQENWQTGGKPITDDLLKAADALINQQSVSGHRYPVSTRPEIDTEDFE